MPVNDSIESVLGYKFKKRELLDQALTTTAYSNEHGGGPNQSEFQTLGDAVLKLVLTDNMMNQGNSTRGDITQSRIEKEKKEGLALVAKKSGIKPVHIGNGQKTQQHDEGDHVLAETLEAIAGAIYLDGGFDKTRDLMAAWFDD
jgi:dsRNA-specific ribonuclease